MITHKPTSESTLSSSMRLPLNTSFCCAGGIPVFVSICFFRSLTVAESGILISIKFAVIVLMKIDTFDIDEKKGLFHGKRGEKTIKEINMVGSILKCSLY